MSQDNESLGMDSTELLILSVPPWEPGLSLSLFGIHFLTRGVEINSQVAHLSPLTPGKTMVH